MPVLQQILLDENMKFLRVQSQELNKKSINYGNYPLHIVYSNQVRDKELHCVPYRNAHSKFGDIFGTLCVPFIGQNIFINITSFHWQVIFNKTLRLDNIKLNDIQGSLQGVPINMNFSDDFFYRLRSMWHFFMYTIITVFQLKHLISKMPSPEI